MFDNNACVLQKLDMSLELRIPKTVEKPETYVDNVIYNALEKLDMNAEIESISADIDSDSEVNYVDVAIKGTQYGEIERDDSVGYCSALFPYSDSSNIQFAISKNVPKDIEIDYLGVFFGDIDEYECR